jgi:hypothetical protein
MCKINCSGGCKECAPEDHLIPGDKVVWKGFIHDVVDYGINWNDELPFVCLRPCTTKFAPLTEVRKI